MKDRRIMLQNRVLMGLQPHRNILNPAHKLPTSPHLRSMQGEMVNLLHKPGDEVSPLQLKFNYLDSKIIIDYQGIGMG